MSVDPSKGELLPPPPADVHTVVYHTQGGNVEVHKRTTCGKWTQINPNGGAKYAEKMQEGKPCRFCGHVLFDTGRKSRKGSYGPLCDQGFYHRGRFCPFTHNVSEAPTKAWNEKMFRGYNAAKMQQLRSKKKEDISNE